ncbi:MAG: hypothetical protein COB37_10305 [Kordiimonadales bacterium]|nr:MAG: hypothetical protein COB37_10305 [Kordiimonadales bacterium]
MAGKKQGTSWRFFSTEMVGIVFAVILALWLEGWYEDFQRRERADDYLERIRVEVSQNREDLNSAINGTQENIDGIAKVFAGGEVTMGRLAPFLEIEGGSTTNSAWTTAQMTQAISEMPVETVTSLATIYDSQAYYAKYLNFFFQQYADLTIDMQSGNNTAMTARKFQQHLSISNSLARQLLQNYDTFLGINAEEAPKQEETAPSAKPSN